MTRYKRAADEVLRIIEQAEATVSDLCHGRKRWRMSIPAQPDSDPDLVIGAALRAACSFIRGEHEGVDEASPGSSAEGPAREVDGRTRAVPDPGEASPGDGDPVRGVDPSSDREGGGGDLRARRDVRVSGMREDVPSEEGAEVEGRVLHGRASIGGVPRAGGEGRRAAVVRVFPARGDEGGEDVLERIEARRRAVHALVGSSIYIDGRRYDVVVASNIGDDWSRDVYVEVAYLGEGADVKATRPFLQVTDAPPAPGTVTAIVSGGVQVGTIRYKQVEAKVAREDLRTLVAARDILVRRGHAAARGLVEAIAEIRSKA